MSDRWRLLNAIGATAACAWTDRETQSYFASGPDKERAMTQPAAGASRNAGSAVMAGQSPRADSRRRRCSLADASRREWMFALTASPNAPSATDNATWRAAERGE